MPELFHGCPKVNVRNWRLLIVGLWELCCPLDQVIFRSHAVSAYLLLSGYGLSPQSIANKVFWFLLFFFSSCCLSISSSIDVRVLVFLLPSLQSLSCFHCVYGSRSIVIIVVAVLWFWFYFGSRDPASCLFPGSFLSIVLVAIVAGLGTVLVWFDFVWTLFILIFDPFSIVFVGTDVIAFCAPVTARLGSYGELFWFELVLGFVEIFD